MSDSPVPIGTLQGALCGVRDELRLLAKDDERATCDVLDELADYVQEVLDRSRERSSQEEKGNDSSGSGPGVPR